MPSLTIDGGESVSIAKSVTNQPVAKLSFNPGNGRGRGSSNPPVTSYEFTIEKLENGSFQEITGSPKAETLLTEQTWSVADTGDELRVTITNTGSSTGTITAQISLLRGDPAINALALYPTIGEILTIQSGLVYADNGKYYSEIQQAVNVATGYVQVGPGSYNENVTITTQNMTVEGTGRGTEINGGSGSPAFTIDGEDITIKDFNADTDTGSNQNAIEVTANGSGALVKNVEGIEAGNIGINGDVDADEVVIIGCRVQNTDDNAINLMGEDCRVEACYAFGGADDGILIGGENSAIIHCYSLQHGNEGLEVEGNGSRCIGNTVEGVADNGILLQGDDCVCNDNVVENSGNDGIRVQGTDDVIVGNRVGGSTNQDIDTGGATTPTQAGNNTGPLN